MKRKIIAVLVLLTVGLEFSLIGSLFFAALGSVSPGKADLVILAVQDPNPLRSSLPQDLARVLARLPGVREVSPEILLFTNVGGRDIVIRGMEPGHLVTGDGARVQGGPEGRNWILAGVGAVDRLSLRIGENLVIPSSFSPEVWVGRITGVFETGTKLDNELVVPLEAARSMAALPEGRVTLFRLWTEGELGSSLVLPTRIPERITLIRGEKGVFDLDLISLSRQREEIGVKVLLGSEILWHEDVEIDPGESLHLEPVLIMNETGTFNGTLVLSNGLRFPVKIVVYEGRLEVSCPHEVVLGRSFSVRVLSGGSPVGGARIRIENVTYITDESGTATLTATVPGLQYVTAEKEGYLPAITYVNVSDYGGKGDPLSSLDWPGTRFGDTLILKGEGSLLMPSKVEYVKMDGAPVQGGALDLSLLSPGEHSVFVRWREGPLAYTGNFTLIVDADPPTIHTIPKSSGYVDDSGGKLIIADDGILGTVVIEGRGVWYIGAPNATLRVPAGTWRVVVSDLAGRVTVRNVTFFPLRDDRFSPSIELSPGNGLTLWVQDDGRIDQVTLSVDGPGYSRVWTWTPYSRTFSVTLDKWVLPPYGLVSVLAVDATGKSSSRSLSAYLGGPKNPDILPPQISLEISDSSLTVKVSDEGAISYVNVSVDGRCLLNRTGGGEISLNLGMLGPGRHTFVVVAEDGAGNRAALVRNYTLAEEIREIRPIKVIPTSKYFLEDSEVRLRLELWSSSNRNLTLNYTVDGVSYGRAVSLASGINSIIIDLGRMAPGYHRIEVLGLEASFCVLPREVVYLELSKAANRIRLSGSDKGLLTYAVRASALSGMIIMGTLSVLSLASGVMALRAVHAGFAENARIRAWLFHALGMHRRAAWRMALRPFIKDLSMSFLAAAVLTALAFIPIVRWVSFFGYPVPPIGLLIGILVMLFLAVWTILRSPGWGA